MKKTIFYIFMFSAFLLTSCFNETTIQGNPVVEQINIREQGDTKYEVLLKTSGVRETARMHTNFRYQVGDTLLSFYEFFEAKLKSERDSLKFYKQKTQELSDELKKQQLCLQAVTKAYKECNETIK